MELDPHAREILAPLHRREQAGLLLTGKVGPLMNLPFEPETAAVAYLVWCAFRRARAPGNMLSGRPAYEAQETLLGRVLSVAQCVGSLREFGHALFERLGLSISQLHARDALWWLGAARAHEHRWPSLSDEMALTEVVTAAKLLDELMFELAKTQSNAEAEEAVQ